ncbi:copper chaperone PCu(A)C [Microvirga sp. VF16]|uniref:copper chaperone PCu(A)C n=1 Tax=Microvirga sp. VF16 TaxID=2807101 RepID=UPI00193D587D|nr:copper chaperone PCu(A)C [Microvirga sp. VF16]QRM34708.1 copper chaperone PCu(A)C [Microvirga sp. VF16]
MRHEILLHRHATSLAGFAMIVAVFASWVKGTPLMKKPLAALLILVATVTSAAAHSYRKGTLMIGHLSAQPARVGEIGKVFGPLLNQGPNQDVLVKIETPVAERAELWLAEEGAKRVDEATLEPKVVLNMLPGGRFIKLIGVRQPLVAGEKFELTLTFKNAGAVVVEAWIEDKPSGR